MSEIERLNTLLGQARRLRKSISSRPAPAPVQIQFAEIIFEWDEVAAESEMEALAC